MDLGKVICALHDSEINGEVSWFYDGVWRVRLGDEANGIDAEAMVASSEEAADGCAPTPSDAIPTALSPSGSRDRNPVRCDRYNSPDHVFAR
jgi:hypothetical protein